MLDCGWLWGLGAAGGRKRRCVGLKGGERDERLIMLVVHDARCRASPHLDVAGGDPLAIDEQHVVWRKLELAIGVGDLEDARALLRGEMIERRCVDGRSIHISKSGAST